MSLSQSFQFRHNRRGRLGCNRYMSPKEATMPQEFSRNAGLTLRHTVLTTVIRVMAAVAVTALPARAAVVADWGTLATPITSETTFSFAQYDLNKNFTDQYLFSLEGESGTSYTVTFQLDACRNGCGNPDLSYGIYDANGGLIGDTNGALTLSAGSYAFQVKGTGMGAGNSLDYWGAVTFSAVSTSIVSAAPEPATLVLMLAGTALLGAGLRRMQPTSLAGATA
jgi:hypothetical protein